MRQEDWYGNRTCIDIYSAVKKENIVFKNKIKKILLSQFKSRFVKQTLQIIGTQKKRYIFIVFSEVIYLSANRISAMRKSMQTLVTSPFAANTSTKCLL